MRRSNLLLPVIHFAKMVIFKKIGHFLECRIYLCNVPKMLFGVVNQLKEIRRPLYPPLRGSVKRKCFVPHIFGGTRRRGARQNRLLAIARADLAQLSGTGFFQFFLEVIRILGIRLWFSRSSLLGVNYSSRLLFPKRIQKFLRFGFNFCFWESEIRSKITFWEQEFPASGNRVFPFPHTLWDQGKSCAKSPETASENRQKQWFWTFWEQESTASDNTNLSKIKEILQNKFKFKLILGSKFDPKMSEIF